MDIFESILELARCQHASDIHFSFYNLVLFRIDGKLIEPGIQVNTIQEIILDLLDEKQKAKLLLIHTCRK